LVEFSLKNLGPSDISCETFDHGEAFVIHMNAKMYGLTALSHPNSTISSTIGLDGVVKLGPELFRRGQEWMVSAVVEGIPELTFDNPLIDTDVISGTAASTFRSIVKQSFAEAIVAALSGR
jgi:hypothetical protein